VPTTRRPTGTRSPPGITKVPISLSRVLHAPEIQSRRRRRSSPRPAARPLRAREGIGPAGVGIVFSIAAVAFVVASALVTRSGRRALTAGVAAVATAALAAPMMLPLLARGAVPLIALVVLRGPIAAVLFGVSYPLCAEGADEVGLGRGAVLGLLNMAWAASAVLGPIGGGAIAQLGGDRSVYLVLIAACLGAAPWMFGCRRLVRLPDPA
jgi:MFS family permease